jgi:mRNA interferase MazF
MRRGDVVTVAAAGDYGQPRPAVIVQTDGLPATHEAVVVCQMTSRLTDVQTFRVMIEPSQGNGLQLQSQIMVDKPVAVRRHRIGRTIGRLAAADIGRLNVALAFVLCLGD